MSNLRDDKPLHQISGIVAVFVLAAGLLSAPLNALGLIAKRAIDTACDRMNKRVRTEFSQVYIGMDEYSIPRNGQCLSDEPPRYEELIDPSVDVLPTYSEILPTLF